MPDIALVVHPARLPAAWDGDALDDDVARFAAASKSAATRRAYVSDLRDFTAWCRSQNATPIPAEPRTLARDFTHLAGLGRSVSTIGSRAAAIAYAHRAFGADLPIGREEVRTVLTGIRNTLCRRPVRKQALTSDLVARVVRKIGTDLAGDRALILLCLSAALRRSELVALDVTDLDQHYRGLLPCGLPLHFQPSLNDERPTGRTDKRDTRRIRIGGESPRGTLPPESEFVLR